MEFYDHLMLIFSDVNDTEHPWWKVNIGSGIGIYLPTIIFLATVPACNESSLVGPKW